MTEAVIVALITGGITLIGNIIALISSAKKTEQNLNTRLSITETKLEALTEEVRIHNDFARRVPVLEAKVEALERKMA